MGTMETATDLPPSTLVADLQRTFGERLEAVVAYGNGTPASTLVLVSTLSADDLAALAAGVRRWHKEGLGTPLVIPREEFRRSLDAFPLEFGEISATRRVLAGRDPFEALEIRVEDRRRACEVQVRSHLLHLRENYLECTGDPRKLAAMVSEAAPAFVGLLGLVARLDGHAPDGPVALARWAVDRAGLDARALDDVLVFSRAEGSGGVDAAGTFPGYLAAVARLARFVDEWRG